MDFRQSKFDRLLNLTNETVIGRLFKAPDSGFFHPKFLKKEDHNVHEEGTKGTKKNQKTFVFLEFHHALSGYLFFTAKNAK